MTKQTILKWMRFGFDQANCMYDLHTGGPCQEYFERCLKQYDKAIVALRKKKFK